MLELFQKVNHGVPLEFITINGDMTAHGFALSEDATPEEIADIYPKLKEIHQLL